MSEASFTIRYDGPALEGGRMAVRDLAPSLLALGDALNAASRLANPTLNPPALAIATTEPGSFLVNLDLVDEAHTFLKSVRDLFAGEDATATVNALALVYVVLDSIRGVKWLFTRRITRVIENAPKPGMVRIIDQQGQSIDLPSAAFQLIQDSEFRAAANSIVAPLDEGRIDEVELRHADQSVAVSSSEKAAFEVPALSDELVVDEDRITLVRITSVAFQEGNKWRVTEGDLSYWVLITDEVFLQRVQHGAEQFGAGDSLRVRMHTRQWDSPDGIKIEREIVEVLEHRHGARQVPLPFADDPEDEWGG